MLPTGYLSPQIRSDGDGVVDCPDEDGTFDAGTDTLLVSFPQTLDLTTDASTALFSDLDVDGCASQVAGRPGRS